MSQFLHRAGRIAMVTDVFVFRQRPYISFEVFKKLVYSVSLDEVLISHAEKDLTSEDALSTAAISGSRG